MIVSAAKIINNAYRQKKIVVAFNTLNVETTLAIARAAYKLNKPIIFEITPKSLEYIGINTMVAMVKTIANEAGGKVPMAIHLDHGKSLEICAAAIKAGFSSVMIDGSDLPFAQNVRLTRQVVKLAHYHGVAVQGEVGALKPRTTLNKRLLVDNELMTDPMQAREFVKLTGVDSLGVAVGTLHGPIKIFRRLPKIDFERLAKINKEVKVPLVLHGGSGVPISDLKKAAGLGVSVVNIDTDLRMVYLSALRWELSKRKKEYDLREIFTPVIEAMSAMVEHKLRSLNE